MVALSPITALLVTPAHAASVVSFAYDALRPDDRRRIADANPDSFFNVIRSDVDYLSSPAPVDLLSTNNEALQRLLRLGRYQARSASLYVYGLESSEHRQLTVVGDLRLSEHRRGRVRAHELTRPAKEEELARHLDALRIHSSPVGLGYRASPVIDAIVADIAARPPLLAFTTPDDVLQQVWSVPGPEGEQLVAAFDRIDVAYIIDGHHRVGATARVAPAGAFLAALIPHDQLRLLPYHRVVAGPMRSSDDAVLDRLAQRFAIEAAPDERMPDRAEEMALYLGRRWWRLQLREPASGRLAVALADDLVLPAFDVTDVRTDPRLFFVPGGGHIDGLVAVADARRGAALALAPPTVEQIFAEADAGRTLPPKSTWFEPKLRSGVFLVRR